MHERVRENGNGEMMKCHINSDWECGEVMKCHSQQWFRMCRALQPGTRQEHSLPRISPSFFLVFREFNARWYHFHRHQQQQQRLQAVAGLLYWKPTVDDDDAGGFQGINSDIVASGFDVPIFAKSHNNVFCPCKLYIFIFIFIN